MLQSQIPRRVAAAVLGTGVMQAARPSSAYRLRDRLGRCTGHSGRLSSQPAGVTPRDCVEGLEPSTHRLQSVALPTELFAVEKTAGIEPATPGLMPVLYPELHPQPGSSSSGPGTRHSQGEARRRSFLNFTRLGSDGVGPGRRRLDPLQRQRKDKRHGSRRFLQPVATWQQPPISQASYFAGNGWRE